MNLDLKEKIEIDYWKNSHAESPENFTKANLLNKLQECRNLDYKFNKYKHILKNKSSILEIGAGQGWASCYLKSWFLPDAHFTVTDISPYAIESISNWERLFEVKIDRCYSAKSYQLDENDSSFDLIFCYAAAHHFVVYEETLRELKRVLKDDGHILFLYEPTSSRFFYPLHYFYVNKIAHHTPEDVIIPSKISAICSTLKLKYHNIYDPNQIILRNIPTAIYFRILKAFPFLQRLLPSSSDMLFTKVK